MRIAIVGAGIGGLTSALALSPLAEEISLFEQSSALSEVGAGLTLSSNVGRILFALGLGEKLDSLASATPSVGTLDVRTGRQVACDVKSYSEADRACGAVLRHVHRADLHQLLANEVRAQGMTIELGSRLTEIQQNDAGVELQFANNTSAKFDIVIACDGLKSVARDRLFETEPPRFTGFVAWRGLVPAEQLDIEPMDPHFATYPASDRFFSRYPIRHGELINYVAIARKPEFRAEGWSHTARTEDLLDEFAEWHPDVRAIINATPEGQCLLWALYTRQPLPSWSNGRVVLLGDAAHPMTPFYGMGAAMAIEDACVLGRSFAKYKDNWRMAIKCYEAARLPRGNEMQRISLQRAEIYMNPDAASRNLLPGAGLEGMRGYNPLTVAL